MSKEHWTVSSVLKAVFLSMSGLGSSTSVMSRADQANAELSDRRTALETGSAIPQVLLKQSGNAGEAMDGKPHLPQ